MGMVLAAGRPGPIIRSTARVSESQFTTGAVEGYRAELAVSVARRHPSHRRQWTGMSTMTMYCIANPVRLMCPVLAPGDIGRST